MKNKFLRLIFSRTGLVTILLGIEILLVFLYFAHISSFLFFYIRHTWIIGLVMLIYFFNIDENISVKMTWISLIFIFPVLGTLLYWYIYFDIGYISTKRKLKEFDTLTKNILSFDNNIYNKLDKNFRNTVRYIKNVGNYNIYENTKVEYLSQGEYVYKDMLKELSKAKKYIFLEYFLIDFGKMWDDILKILVEKVKEGVEVRIMYDGTSVYYKIPYDYNKQLRKLGIKVRVFSPLKPFISTNYNNRDHRKIMIIDGKVAYTGGVNLSDEHVNLINPFGHWKDNAIKIKGEAIREFILMFLKMWNFKKNVDFNKYKKYLNSTVKEQEEGFILPYGYSPFNKGFLAENVYLDLINNAKDYVYITTPYLVPSDEMINTLIRASKKGIDIRIIVPKISDSKIAYHLGRSYYRKLLSSGVKIYEYSPGFIHSKSFIIDSEIAVVGTINIDYRSLYHHFECAALIYKKKVIEDILIDIKQTIFLSHEIIEKDLKKEKIYHKIYRALMKFIAPLI